MIINILKKEDEKIYFELYGILHEFNYDGLDAFIESFYSNSEKVEINCSDEFIEYKKLLDNILIECRKKTYVEAVNKAIKTQEQIDELIESDTNK